MAEAGVSSFFDTSDGWRLHVESWPLPWPRAHLLYAHGLNECTESKAARRIAEVFNKIGLSVDAVDHHGHGLSLSCRGSEKTKGLIRSVSLVADHLEEVCLHLARQRERQLPVVLVGHSLGGAAVGLILERVRTALEREGLGGSPTVLAVLLAPAHAPEAEGVVRLAARVLRLFSWLKIMQGEDGSKYDPDHVRPPESRNYSGWMPAGTVASFLTNSFNAKWWLLNKGGARHLFVVCGQDEVMPAESFKPFEDAAEFARDFLVLKDSTHNLLLDPIWKEAFAKVVSWVDDELDELVDPGPIRTV